MSITCTVLEYVEDSHVHSHSVFFFLVLLIEVPLVTAMSENFISACIILLLVQCDGVDIS